MTAEAIVDTAVQQGLNVIAITDHNSNKSVQAAIDHAQTHDGRILVLAGVEVTTAHGHLLAYFAPDRVADLTKFLARLDLEGEMGADNTHTKKSMSDVIAEAHRVGGICVAAHIDREKTGFDKFAPGFQSWKKDILTSPGLYGIECDASPNLCWYTEKDDKSADGLERRKLFNARSEIKELKGRHHLACIQGSDSHTMEQFCTASPDKPWTRMKLNALTFDGVRIALVDANARVRACAAVPRTIPRIRGMALTGGFLDSEVIHFSDNLNCFIGGRGTGKSTAIRSLAYAFGLMDEFEEYDNCPHGITVYCDKSPECRDTQQAKLPKNELRFVSVPCSKFRFMLFEL